MNRDLKKADVNSREWKKGIGMRIGDKSWRGKKRIYDVTPRGTKGKKKTLFYTNRKAITVSVTSSFKVLYSSDDLSVSASVKV